MKEPVKNQNSFMAGYLIPPPIFGEPWVILYQNHVFDSLRTAPTNPENRPDNPRVCSWF
jgi:hypothetical protein